MPYSRETAGKGGHADFVRNPDVQDFLNACDYLRIPSDAEANNIASSFMVAPTCGGLKLPSFVVASDASKSDAPINDKLPSTQLGFIKVSHVLIAMNKYSELTRPGTRFVDPFKVAEIHRNATPITYVLPGSNIRYRGASTVRDGFRRAVFDQLSANRRDDGNRMVLAETLLALNDGHVQLKSCPCCGSGTVFLFSRGKLSLPCPCCGKTVFVSDWLRLHEGISDFGDNGSAMTRMMNALEHLLLAAFIIEMLDENPLALSKVAFVIDGPLALFGEPAKLHQRMMALLFRVNCYLNQLGAEPMLFIGLQKSGNVMDHAMLLQRFLPNGVLRLIDDDYRYRYIIGGEASSTNFGNETYYGQDFLFKTERGRIFNFALPYPYSSKELQVGGRSFVNAKSDIAAYGEQIHRACDLIRHFELDLYDNAIVPVALAHRHASISLVPGGKVLDVLTRAGLQLDKAT